MATITRPRIVTKAEVEDIGLPEQVIVALADLAETAKQGLLALCVGLGLAVIEEIFQEELTGLVGPKGKHAVERHAYRHGQERRRVTLGGRRVKIQKPRARTLAGAEVELQSYRFFTGRDLLSEMAVGRMLAGLSTRRYRAGLEPIGELEPLATSRSAISRRFVEGTQRKLDELMSRDLSKLELLAVFVDGLEVGEHCVVVALGVDGEGRKHPLGLWEGSTENKSVCQALLSNLVERGLSAEVSRLYVIDGGKAIRSAIQASFGAHALVQRCRYHKRHDVLQHLPEAERPLIRRRLERAWAELDPERAEAELRALADQLEEPHPGAAASLREGLEETLTVTRLGLTPALTRTLRSTNPLESMISVGRQVTRNVKTPALGQDGVALDAGRDVGGGEAIPARQRLPRPSPAPAGAGQPAGRARLLPRWPEPKVPGVAALLQAPLRRS